MCVGGGELAYMWKLINDQRYSLGSRHQCKAQANTHANVVLIGREINNIYSLSTPSITFLPDKMRSVHEMLSLEWPNISIAIQV